MVLESYIASLYIMEYQWQRESVTCKLTLNTSIIEDEKHFLYDCTLYVDLRKKYFGDFTHVGDVCIDTSHVCDLEHEDWHCIYHGMIRIASAMLL